MKKFLLIIVFKLGNLNINLNEVSYNMQLKSRLIKNTFHLLKYKVYNYTLKEIKSME